MREATTRRKDPDWELKSCHGRRALRLQVRKAPSRCPVGRERDLLTGCDARRHERGSWGPSDTLRGSLRILRRTRCAICAVRLARCAEVWWSRVLKGEPAIDVKGIEAGVDCRVGVLWTHQSGWDFWVNPVCKIWSSGRSCRLPSAWLLKRVSPGAKAGPRQERGAGGLSR